MSDSGDIDDWLDRIAMGDREAFRALYARTSARLFAVCLHILEDRSDAEDALQDTYVQIWKTPDFWEAASSAPTIWLTNLARSAALDRLRARDSGAKQQPGPRDWSVAEVALPWPRVGRLASCLDLLHSDRAAMIRRAYLKGEGYGDLARATGVSTQKVRLWLRRSLTQLREDMLL